MRNRIIYISLLLLFLTFKGSAAKPLVVIELGTHPGGTYMMTMKATVNGTEGLFMFDTGGGVSYVSPDFAKSVGCTPWGADHRLYAHGTAARYAAMRFSYFRS
jgi:hypothetical protein